MRLTTMMVVAIFALTGTDAYAGKIQIKKAKRQVGEKAAAGLAKIKKACGHATLTAPIDWSGADKVSDAALKKEGRTRVNAYNVFGSLVEYFLKDVAKLCGDADYKAELKKLRAIPLITPGDIKHTRLKLKLGGGKLEAFMPLFTASDWSDGSGLAKLKKVF